MDVSVLPPNNGQQAQYPRPLTQFEREALLWLLPEDKPGYSEYRKYVTAWSVVAAGRRGTGNFILGATNTVADNEAPLPQVFAYGMIESGEGDISVTLRERVFDQLEFEIVTLRGDSLPQKLVERRRWNFSDWVPDQTCPACGTKPRCVTIYRETGLPATLAICSRDKRLWIYDAQDGVNHLIPVTNFHNALMIQKGIRDPEEALAAGNLFTHLGTFSDADLTAAFVQYNKLRKKVALGAVTAPHRPRRTLFERVFSLFGK